MRAGRLIPCTRPRRTCSTAPSRTWAWAGTQWQLFVVVGFGWASDNIFPIATSLILGPVAREFAAQRPPLLTLAQNIGLLAGAVFWGFGCDVFGRRWAFNLTLGCAAVWSMAAAASPSFAAVAVFAALWSFGVGGNLPVDSAIFPRVPAGVAPVPADGALGRLGAGPGGGHAGGLAAAGRQHDLPPAAAAARPRLCRACASTTWAGATSSWPWAGSPFAMFVARFALFRIHESPKYLAGRGRDDDAVAVVRKVALANGRDTALTVDDLRACEPEGYGGPAALVLNDDVLVPSRVRALFATPRLALSTGLAMAVWALLGLAFPLYNAFLPFIQTSRSVDFGDGSAYLTYRNSLIIAAVGVPGALLGGVPGRAAPVRPPRHPRRLHHRHRRVPLRLHHGRLVGCPPGLELRLQPHVQRHVRRPLRLHSGALSHPPARHRERPHGHVQPRLWHHGGQLLPCRLYLAFTLPLFSAHRPVSWN